MVETFPENVKKNVKKKLSLLSKYFIKILGFPKFVSPIDNMINKAIQV